MPQDWFAQNAPKAGGDWFSANAPEAQPAKSKVESITQGAKEGGQDLWGMLKAISDASQVILNPTSPAAARGRQMAGDTVRGVVGAARAIPDVVRHVANPETRGATLRGFMEGGVEGSTGLSIEETKADPWRAGARFTVNTVLPALTIKGGRMATAARAPKAVVESAQDAAMRLAKERPFTPAAEPKAQTSRVPYRAPDATEPKPQIVGKLTKTEPRTIMDDIAEALEDTRKTDPPKRVDLPPPAAQPDVTYPRQAARRTQRTTERPAEKIETPAQEPPVTDTPGRPAGEWIEPKGKPGVRVRPKPGVAAELRAAYGAKDAAHVLGIGEADVRRLAPGPSRIPYAATHAQLDADYRRMLDDPRGFMDAGLAVKLGLPVAGAAAGGALADDNPLAGTILGALAGIGAANPAKTANAVQTLRMTGMLSGLAVPKSMMGNAGAFLTAAAEKGSTAPLKEALRLPTNLKNAAVGWKGKANPSGTQGIDGINIPGRIMGALDESTTQALQRAGLSLEEAQRLLLTKPNPLGPEASKVLATPVGKMVFPFQRTPFNGAFEGIKSVQDLLPGSGASNVKRGLTLGAGAAGAAAGDATDNPMLLALLAALMGPRAAPFALGAAATAGPSVMRPMSVGVPEGSWKDLIDPLRPIDRPAIMRLLEGGR